MRSAQSEINEAIQQSAYEEPTWFNKDHVASQELGRQCALAAKRAGLSDDELKIWLTSDTLFKTVLTAAAKYEEQGMPKSEQIIATSDFIENLVRVDEEGSLKKLLQAELRNRNLMNQNAP